MFPLDRGKATLFTEIKTLLMHSSVYGTAEFLKKGIGFFMIPIYTRYLVPADYGLLELLDLTLNVIAMLVGMHIGTAIIRYYHHFEDPKDKQQVFTTALIFIFALSIVALAILELFSHSISALVTGGIEYVRFFQIIFVSMAVETVYLVSENYLLARKKSVLYSALSVGNCLVALSLNILFVVVFKMGVMGILLSMLITKLANGIAVISITVKGVSLSFSWEKLCKMIRYALPLVPAAFSLFVMHFSDRFFVQRFCDLNDLGIYSLGYKFGMIISVVVSEPIFRVWNTQRFEIAKQPDAKEVLGRAFTYYLAVVTFAGLGISVYIDEVIHIMASSPYQGAATVVPLIVLSYIFYGMANFFTLGIMITFKTKYAAYVQMTIAGMNLLLNMFFVSRYGIMGAAVSTLLSFLCLAVLTLLVSQKLYRVFFEYGRILALFAVSGGIFALCRYIDVALLLSLSLKSLLLMTFPLALFLLGLFRRKDIASGSQLLRGQSSSLTMSEMDGRVASGIKGCSAQSLRKRQGLEQKTCDLHHH